MNKRNKYWMVCVIVVIAIMVAGYTPLMIPEGLFKPTLLGMPYSLWTSILATVVLVILTYIGGKVHPGNDEEEVGS